MRVDDASAPSTRQRRETACDGGHDWAYMGAVYGSVRTGCEHPSVLRCNRCLLPMRTRCNATRDRKCQPCAERHRKDISRVGRTGAKDRPDGVHFVTLTAPGRHLLPWDERQCKHAEGATCSGSLGCRVGTVDAAAWNATAPRRWNDFITDLRRLLAPLDVQYFGSWETQQRGLLHRHALISAPGVTRKRMAVYVRSLARKHGFGTRSDVQTIDGADSRSIARTAGYIASYVTKGGERATMMVLETGELRPDGKGYRPWSMSRRWGPTLGAVRAERREWCRRAAAVPTALYGAVAGQSADDGGEYRGEAPLDLEQEIYALERILINDLGGEWV